MRVLVVLFALSIVLATTARAETGAALHLGTDAIKPALGLPNLEVEVQIDKTLTAHVFGEMLAFETPFTPKDHPAAYARAGIRYFAWTFQETTRATGLFGGVGAGAMMTTLEARPSPVVNGEVGYKLVLLDMLQIAPRVYANVPLDGQEPTPGFELMVGVVF